MTSGPTGLRAKSFAVLADAADCATVLAPVEAPPAAATATASRSVYHERCFLVDDDLDPLRHSVASGLRLPAVRRAPGGDVRREFFRRVSRALEALESRPTRSTAKAADPAGREARMDKPMFVTTVRSGVFLEPPPEVAVLLGLRKNGSDERLANRKPQHAKSTEVVYSFASKPRIVASTNEPPTPPNGPSAANRKRLFKRQVDDPANRNGCTMTSTAAAMDGSIQFGGNTMHDRRVARGSNFASLRFNAPTTENVLSRQAEARRRAAVRQRAQIRARKLRSRTPPPVDGRKHGEMQTDKYLEELTEREMNTSAVGCQADLLPIDDDEDYRYTSSISNTTTPRIDAQTQLDENDLIFPSQSIDDYDEVRGNTVIVSTVNKILKEAILEINAEIEKFQNTKEIVSTKLLQSGRNENHTIIFTKHELCSLMRNFNAQNEHSDWPVLDFDETSYNSLVDDVFEHLRLILTNLDFLANITQEELKFRQTKLPKKSASPPSSPSENSETTRSIKTINETIPDNNTNIQSEEISNPTTVPKTNELETKKNEKVLTSDSLDAQSDHKEIQEKSNSIVNEVDAPGATSEAEILSKSSIATLEEKYSMEKEVNKVDENPVESIQVNPPEISNNAETTISKPKRNASQDSSMLRDEKEFDEKSETEMASEQQVSNPQVTDEETERTTQSAEMNNDKDDLLDPSVEEALTEKIESENSTIKNSNSDEGISNKTRANGSEVQQRVHPDSLNIEEIHNHKNEQSISDNFKPLPDQDNKVRPNETSEIVLTERVSDETNLNYTDAEGQDGKSEIKGNLKDEAEQENSEKQQEQNKPITDDNTLGERLTSSTKSELEIKNTELKQPQLDQKQPSKSDEEKSNDDEVDDFSSQVSNDTETEKEPPDVNYEITTSSNSIEEIQGDIPAKLGANKTTLETKNSEEKQSSQESNGEIIEESTSFQTKTEENIAEDETNSLKLVDSPLVPEITVQHIEMDHANEVEGGTEIKYKNEENQKILKDSEVQLSENNPSNTDAKEEADSELNRSNRYSVNENTTSTTNFDDDDDDDDNDKQVSQQVLEEQEEPSAATKVENASNDQRRRNKDKVDSAKVDRMEDTSDNLQDMKDITNQDKVSEDESNDTVLQIENIIPKNQSSSPDSDVNLNQEKRNSQDNDVPKKNDSLTGKEDRDDLDVQNSTEADDPPEDNSISSLKTS